MDAKVAKMIQGFVAHFNGDTEKTARFMRDKLRIGGIVQCRAFIAKAMAAQ